MYGIRLSGELCRSLCANFHTPNKNNSLIYKKGMHAYQRNELHTILHYTRHDSLLTSCNAKLHWYKMDRYTRLFNKYLIIYSTYEKASLISYWARVIMSNDNLIKYSFRAVPIKYLVPTRTHHQKKFLLDTYQVPLWTIPRLDFPGRTIKGLGRRVKSLLSHNMT